MSEDSRRGFGSRGSGHKSQNEYRPLEQPTGRRRRSLDEEGGTSVSDLLAKHGGKQLPPQDPFEQFLQQPQAPQQQFSAPPQRPPAPPQQPPLPASPPPVPQGAPHSGQWPADPAAPPHPPAEPPSGGRRRAREQPSGPQRVPEPPFDPRLAPPQRPPQPPPPNRPPLEQPSARRLAPPEPPQATGRRALQEPPVGRPPAEQPTGRRALPDPPQQQPLPPPGMPQEAPHLRRTAEPQQGRRFPQANPPMPPGAPAPGPARQPQRPPLEQPSTQQRFPRDHNSGPQRLPGGPVPPPAQQQAPAPPAPPAPSQQTSAESDFELDERRRKIDATLARFSAVHDEMAEIEQAEKQRRSKLTRLIRLEESAELGPEFSAQLKSKLDADDRAIRSPKVPIRQLHAMMHHAAPDHAERDSRNGTGVGSGAVGASGDEALTTVIPQVPEHEPEDDAPEEDVVEDVADGDDGDDGEPPVRPPQRLHPKARLALRGLAVAVAVVVFAVVGTGWVTKVWVDGQLSAREVDALDENSSSILHKDKQYGAANFLMVGSDTRANSKAEDGVGNEVTSEGARSDTVMIAHVPADRKRVVMVSFPRDLNTQIPDCDAWDPKTGKTTSRKVPGSKQKLNAAYAIGGPKCLTKLVQNLSGLHINHFVAIDFQGFKAMVDAVKGVEICVSKPMKDAEIGVVIPDAGRQTINGDAALSYVRARKVEGDTTGDYGRIKRQQAFLSSLLRKAMSSQVLTSPSRLSDFASAFAKATYGENIGVSQLLTLGESLHGLEPGRVTFTTVPTTTTKLENNSFREDLRVEATKALFTAIIHKTPLPGEKPASNGTPDPQAGGPVGPPPTAKEVPVQVLNGSSKPRLAETTAESLRRAGFQVVNVSGAGEQVQRTVIRYSAERALHAKVLQNVVPGALLEEVPNMGGSVRLLLGPEFEWKASSGGGQGQSSSPPTPPPLPKDLSTVNAADDICK
ncbi:LCP family protein [Allokutzneria albata]|uniref:Cell envelope-related function transcriptional attenuator common domain-containing protein n=1 Tax=Allokutzneria albata TaxID=211114 RepID=A0A1G9ZB43_ALLAB|nr:LCP family protein [Allokutzneria albata]SDN18660.1 cell envelope-related function transcriptional attenuator common domain-containing protein [Allokutzneria albata]